MGEIDMTIKRKRPASLEVEQGLSRLAGTAYPPVPPSLVKERGWAIASGRSDFPWTLVALLALVGLVDALFQGLASTLCVPSATSPAPKQPSVQKNTEDIQEHAAVVERSASSLHC